MQGWRSSKKTGADRPGGLWGGSDLPRGLSALTLGGLCTRARAACDREAAQLGLGDARARLWPELGLRLGLGFELR